MLPAQHRLRTGAEFSAVTRGPRGARAGSRLLVVQATLTDSRAVRPPRFGFVVSKAVGGAVTRNLVKRRLRAGAARVIEAVPAGVDIVVRAQSAASDAPYDVLVADLERLVDAVVDRASTRAR